MEASGMGGDGAAQNGGSDGQQGGTQTQGGPDFNAFTSQLESLSSSQNETREALQSVSEWVQSQQQQQGDGQEEAAEFDPTQFGLDPYADDAQLQQFAQGLQSYLQPLAQENQQLRQEMQQFAQQMGDFKTEWGARDLVGEIPDLADPDYAKHVVETAGQLAESMNRPELANEPKFWRLTHFALAAEKAANTEGADAPAAAHLEGGGGAAPAGGSQANEPFFSTDEGGGRLPW